MLHQMTCISTKIHSNNKNAKENMIKISRREFNNNNKEKAVHLSTLKRPKLKQEKVKRVNN